MFLNPADNKGFNGAAHTAGHKTEEDASMFDEEFDEEEDHDDEEDEEFDEEEYEDDDEYEDWEPSSEAVPRRPAGERLEAFVADPWPRVTFILIIVGFAVILPWPAEVWFQHNYLILGYYVSMIFGLVGIALSLEAWVKSQTRVRYVGPAFIIAILITAAVGTADTISWAMNGASILYGIDTPLVSLTVLIGIFAVYSMWIVRRSYAEEKAD